jgi:hypothetical protein
MLSIDDTTINPSKPSCFENKTLWQYGSSRSSLIISNGSLQSNQTYHFKVYLTNIQTPSIVYSGDLLIQIEDDITMTIVVKYV